ncbi:uncharacterized protein LOC123875765 [Maniola jurtina]|uniref:uncharacterized protein LOC123875765 n=1 Tax=Maniola jurtina TaxID=191418 RepID=UPI001E68D73F|nr:uncharacterized protein LOC123875765 [Maniola jurtina]
MLSPLYIASNSEPVENTEVQYSEITPEMIFEAVRNLSMWRQDVPTSSILDHISRNYPVNRDKKALLHELSGKLRICVMLGIVSEAPNETWRISCQLQNRMLTTNHVTMFWNLYADTLKPIKKKDIKTQKPRTKHQAQPKTLTTFDEDMI